MASHILSVSYDEALLETRQLILQRHGYQVTSALGFQHALQACKDSSQSFRLFILGHSIPPSDKKALIKQFREHCNAPVIALTRVTEPRTAGADYYIEPDPTPLLALVASILRPLCHNEFPARNLGPNPSGFNSAG
jgi:DNA-binding response OmpR family regulator